MKATIIPFQQISSALVRYVRARGILNAHLNDVDSGRAGLRRAQIQEFLSFEALMSACASLPEVAELDVDPPPGWMVTLEEIERLRTELNAAKRGYAKAQSELALLRRAVGDGK